MYYGLDFYLPLSCACVRARVCVRVSMCECFFVCMFCMPCVEWVWMFFVLLFYVIYSRTIASIANVFCWLYPTLNKVYLILSYLILSYHHILLLNQQPICLWFETSRRYVHVSVTVMMFQDLYCMMTSSNGNVLRVTGHLCGEFTGPGEFPAQRPVTRSFGVFSDLRLNKRLSKQSWGWWFETPSSPLWRPCNDHKQPIA